MTEPVTARWNVGLWLAVLAAVVCTVVSIRLYLQVGELQSLWPFPALYLVEITGLSWLAASVLSRPSRRSAAIACAVAGALMGFSILGAFSVGVFYAPIAVLLTVAGALVVWRTKLSFLSGLGCYAGAGIAQAGLMLIIVRLLPSVLILAAAPAGG